MVQLSHPCIIIGKTIAITRQSFVGKIMSLLFNMLSRLVIAFVPRSKHLLILWLQLPSAIILCWVSQSCPTLCDPMNCNMPGSSVHWYSPCKKTRVGCHALLQGILLTQGSKPGLQHCRQILYQLSHQGSSDFIDQENKSVTVSIVSPSICHEVMGLEDWRNSSRNNEEMEPKQKQVHLWMWLVMDLRSDAVKKIILYRNNEC